MEKNVYYVYTLARPDGRVFYVGKGNGRRWDGHEVEAKAGKEGYKCRIIRKVWAEGGQIVKQKMLEDVCEKDAFECEKALIAFYGRGNLANLTDGGEGPSGFAVSAETRAKLSARSRGRAISLETRTKLSEFNKGKSPSPEARAKIGAASRGRKPSAETCAKISAAKKGHGVSIEARLKIGAATKGRPVSAETRAKKSAAGKGRPHKPEHRANLARANWERAHKPHPDQLLLW